MQEAKTDQNPTTLLQVTDLSWFWGGIPIASIYFSISPFESSTLKNRAKEEFDIMALFLCTHTHTLQPYLR